MKIYLVSDLHISESSSADSAVWLDHFCDFFKYSKDEEVFLFFLGDIVNCGKTEAFLKADNYFYRLGNALKGNYHFFFLPGNHDYCDGTLLAFNDFIGRHQSYLAKHSFDDDNAFNVKVGTLNFILINSINHGDYNSPGKVKTELIQGLIDPNCCNIILMHHSIVPEQGDDHLGILEISPIVRFFLENNISLVIHGHSHESRHYYQEGFLRVIGVGSIGLENEALTDTVNEQEQFLEIVYEDGKIKDINNYLYRSGSESYEPIMIFSQKEDESYRDLADSFQTSYSEPELYIPRKVIEDSYVTDQADGSLFLYQDKKTSLYQVCSTSNYVLLVSEAGNGKTYEMQHLAYLIQERKELIPLFLPLEFYNHTSLKDYIVQLFPHLNESDLKRSFLIMDGYDEIDNPSSFKKALSFFIKQNPDVKICISLRSNFYNHEAAFYDFVVVRLLGLSSKDIEEFCNNNAIRESEFIGECKKKNLNGLLTNPFYFKELVSIYNTVGKLPEQNKLAETIIETYLEKDNQKYATTFSDPLLNHKHDMVRAYKKMSFSMQLKKTVFLSETEYQALLQENDRNWLKYGSLVDVRNGRYFFRHNIFREYFVASHLSTLSVTEIRQYVEVRDNIINAFWLNSLGMTLQLRTDQELEIWLLNEEPLLLTRLESACVDDSLKRKVYLSAVDTVANKNIWFDNTICSEQQLAAFIQCEVVFEEILEEIRNPQTEKTLILGIKLLSFFSDFFGRDKEVHTILLGLLDLEKTPIAVKQAVVLAFSELALKDSETVDHIVRGYGYHDSRYLRTAVYDLIHSLHCENQYVDVLLDGLIINHKEACSDNYFYATDYYVLNQCLREIDSTEAISKVFQWHTHEENAAIKYHGEEDLFSGFIDKAIALYLNGDTILYESICGFFSVEHNYYLGKYLDDIIRFFDNTNTLEQWIQFVRSNCVDFWTTFYPFMVIRYPEVRRTLLVLYDNNKIEDEEFYEYISRIKMDLSYALEGRILYERKTGNKVETKEPALDFEARLQMDRQICFDSLFSIEELEKLLDTLIHYHNQTKWDRESMYLNRSYIEDYPIGVYTLGRLINGFLSEGKDIMSIIGSEQVYSEFLQYGVFQLLDDNVDLSTKQKDILKNYYDELAETIDFKKAITKTGARSYSIQTSYLFYKQLGNVLKLDYCDQYNSSLFLFPYFYEGFMQTDEKYDYLESVLPKDMIEETIKKRIRLEEDNKVILDLLDGCNRYQLDCGVDAAVSICHSLDCDKYDKRLPLSYIIEQKGFEYAAEKVLFEMDDETFALLLTLFDKYESKKINDEIVRRYNLNHSDNYIQLMIMRGIPRGLKEFVILSTTAKKPIESGFSSISMLEAISHIHDKAFLPYLCDAVRMLFSGDFEDVKIFSLSNALFKAFTNCASEDEETAEGVLNSIIQLQKELIKNRTAITFFSYLTDAINQEYNMMVEKKWSNKEIIDELKKII